MEIINKLIKLVGLEYYMSIEQREEFFKSWSHTSILIKPDKENPKDKTALEAFDDDWNNEIGFAPESLYENSAAI